MEASKLERDLVDGLAGKKDTKPKRDSAWNNRATSDRVLACFQSTGLECESVDDKPDRVERERLARTLDYSFLEDQTGLADLEKRWLRALPFGTLMGDRLDLRECSPNLLRFPNCRGGERKRPLRRVVEVGWFQPNSCCFLYSLRQLAAFSRCRVRFRVAG